MLVFIYCLFSFPSSSSCKACCNFCFKMCCVKKVCLLAVWLTVLQSLLLITPTVVLRRVQMEGGRPTMCCNKDMIPLCGQTRSFAAGGLNPEPLNYQKLPCAFIIDQKVCICSEEDPLCSHYQSKKKGYFQYKTYFS